MNNKVIILHQFQCLNLMYAKESSGTQMQPQIILKSSYIPDYLSVYYDCSSKYKRRLLKIICFIFSCYYSLDVRTGPLAN